MANKPGNRRRRRALIVTSACLTTVGAAIVLNAWVIGQAAPHLRTIEAAKKRSPKAVVLVLGASVRADGTPSRVLRDRLAAALEVAGATHDLLLTGDGLTAQEIAGMRNWLVERGVARERLLEDPAGLRTWDSMRRAKDVFKIDDVIVVTNAFHLARAVYLARAAGLRAIGVPAPAQKRAPHWKNHVRESAARVRSVVDVTLGVTAAHPTGYGPKADPTSSG